MRRIAIIAVCLASAAGGLSACGSSGGAATSGFSGHTLTIPLQFDPAPLDPDQFYGSEGLTITNSVYQGLLQYAPNSTKIEPLLAKSYTESSDGLTYTLQLEPGVKFHDGTPFTSQAFKFDIQREGKSGGGPSYMVSDIASVATPAPTTLVIKLKQPETPFLQYLASPYGPKAISPTVVKAHDPKHDGAKEWLQTHDAGTGPYMLSKTVPGQSYQLTAFPGYWGSRPFFTTIDMPIIANSSTQELELNQGQLSMMLHNLNPQTLPSYQKNSQYQVLFYPSSQKTVIALNPNTGIFSSAGVRKALAEAINRAQLVSTVYGPRATVSTGMFTLGSMPPGTDVYNAQYDPSVLRALVKNLPSKKVDIAYFSADQNCQRIAELLQTELSGMGLDATTRGADLTESFAWVTHPAGRPDIFIQDETPDDFDPSSFPSIYYAHNGPLSYFTPPNAAGADKLLNQALHTVNQADAYKLYSEASAAYRDTYDSIPLADVKEVIVARSGIAGWEYDRAAEWSIRPWTLTAG
jgi:peptide/nickel transport system substrate-binding protein